MVVAGVPVGMAPVDMGYFAARDEQPAEYCRGRVRRCEVYLAVVGFRYGSVVPGEAISYTELEFAEAGAVGLPRLLFLLEEGAAGPVDADRGAVDGFRERLRGAGLITSGTLTANGARRCIGLADRQPDAGQLIWLRQGSAVHAREKRMRRRIAAFW